MLEIAALFCIVAWVVALAAGQTMGGMIHLLFLPAALFITVRVIQRRKSLAEDRAYRDRHHTKQR